MKSASILISNKNHFPVTQALVEVNQKPLIHYIAQSVSQSVEKIVSKKISRENYPDSKIFLACLTASSLPKIVNLSPSSKTKSP